MADQQMKIGLDVSDMKSSAKAAQMAMKELNNQIEESVVVMQKYNSAGKLVESVQKSMTASGQIITEVLKRKGDSFRKVSTTVQENKQAINELLDAEKKLESQRLEQAATAAKTFLGGFDNSNVAGAAGPLQKRMLGAQNRLVGALAGSGLSDADVGTMFERIKAGFLDVETGARSKVQVALLGVKQTFEEIDKSQEKAVGSTAQARFKAWQKEMQANQKEAGGFLISLEGIGRLLQAALLRHAAFAVAGFFYNAIKESLNYQEALRKVSVAIGDVHDRRNIGGTFTNLAVEFNLDRIELSKIAHDQLGNSLRNAAYSSELLHKSLVLQSVTALDAAQSMTLLDRASRMYRLTTADLTAVSDQYYNALKQGNVNSREFSSGIQHLQASAKDLGLNLQETLSVFTYFTQKGYDTRDAISTVEGIINKLLHPTKDMMSLFDKWGVSSGQAAIQTFGLTGVLQKLAEEYQSGGLRRLGELEKDIRAIRGAIELLGDQNLVENIARVNREIGDGTTGALARARAEAELSMSFWESYWRDFRAGMRTMGDALNVNGPATSPETREMLLRWQAINQAQEERATALLRRSRLRDNFTTVDFNRETQQFLGEEARRRSMVLSQIHAYTEADTHITSTLARTFGAFTQNIGQETATVRRYLSDISKEYDAAQKRLGTLRADRDRRLFEREIANLSPLEQHRRTTEKVEELNQKAFQNLLDNKDLDETRSILKEIDRLLESMYNRQQAWRKEAEKLGVKFTTPIDTSLEQRNFRMMENIETGTMANQRESYRGILIEVEKLIAAETRYNALIRERARLFDRNFPAAPANEIPQMFQRSLGGFMQAFAAGGYVKPKYMADGGPVGVDTMAAWLDPREYVMDAANTAKFFPQLVSMTMGLQPQQSSINNSVSVGDINIAYQGTDSPQTDVRRLGEMLRREIRRGTIKL